MKQHYYCIRSVDETGKVYSFTGVSLFKGLARFSANISLRRYMRRTQISLRIVRTESFQVG